MKGRDPALTPLFAGAQSLPGVGARLAERLAAIGARRVIDLLFTPPTGLLTRTRCASIEDASPGSIATIPVHIQKHFPPARKGSPWRVQVQDAQGGTFMIVFFHAQEGYLAQLLPVRERRVVSGKVEIYDHRPQMIHPDHAVAEADIDQIASCEANYPLSATLTQKTVRKAVNDALARLPALPEWLDGALLEEKGWPSWQEALRQIHHPRSAFDITPEHPARMRLAYDELLAHQLTLALVRAHMRRNRRPPLTGDGRLRKTVAECLPYALTGAQRRVICDIERDLASDRRMLRLMQGDVGSGKTLVALMAMLIAAEAGGQSAMMAPTELLARQHMRTLAPFLEACGLHGVALFSRDSRPDYRMKCEAIASGEAQIAIGTHALFQEGVNFANLRLAVIDEQHRFGVSQRLRLSEKGAGAADILAMSATPIPRTLALAALGFMDVSILDELPPGRKPVATHLIRRERLSEVVEGVARAIRAGRRVYWVCPQIRESEASDLAAVEDRHAHLAQIFGARRVALAHGRIATEAREDALRRFAEGAVSILVATTIVEVGIDVPEASVMIVEQAERFGLSQLHQLRGRVGRGAGESICLLLHDARLGAARERLRILRETSDGFHIAEADLRLRDAGDLVGLRQSGLPPFRIAEPGRQEALFIAAHHEAQEILARDSLLVSERGQALRLLLTLHEHREAMMYVDAL